MLSEAEKSSTLRGNTNYYVVEISNIGSQYFTRYEQRESRLLNAPKIRSQISHADIFVITFILGTLRS